jgi:hypothetical protein
MTMFRKSLLALAAGAALMIPQTAGAVRQWMLPSETMFMGSGNEWLTVDLAISDDLFYVNHPGQDWNAVVTAPDGSIVPVENRMVGKLRQTFDVPIKAKGTYKVAVTTDMVMGNYMLNGERKMLPRGTTPATLKDAIPEGATDVQTAEANSRLETFVTAGVPTDSVFVTTGKGLEMVPVTHPNDVVAGEPATFKFLLDGKPAANLDVVAIPGGVRYRGELKQIDAKTDAEGKVSLTLPDAGMYWVNISMGGRRGPGGPGAGGAPGGKPAAGEGAGLGGPGAPRSDGPPQRRASYAMVIEVQG